MISGVDTTLQRITKVVKSSFPQAVAAVVQHYHHHRHRHHYALPTHPSTFKDPEAINPISQSGTELVGHSLLILGWDKDPERYKLTADSGFAHVTKCVLNGSCLDMSRGDPLF
ncbi:hypothetical protein ACI65C_012500 [Semiaphis heraclei]